MPKLSSLAAALVLLLAGCSAPPAGETCTAGSVSRLYLGLNTPTGVVTETQWQGFVAETVTRHFPDGFTVLAAQGQWRAPDGTNHQETTRVLEVVHDDDPRNRTRVQAVAHDYKRRFAQESVLVTRAPVRQCSHVAGNPT